MSNTLFCRHRLLTLGTTLILASQSVYLQAAEPVSGAKKQQANRQVGQSKDLLAPAQSKKTGLGPSQLLDLAMRFDKTYQAALAQHRANLEGKNQALAAYLPNVNLTAQANREDSTRSAFGFSSNSTSNPRNFSINLRQALFQPKAWLSYKQAELSNQASELNLRQAKQDLVLRVFQAYVDLLTAQDTLRTLAAQKSAVSQQLEAAKVNFEVGTATITDQQEAQSRFDLIVAQELAAQNQFQVAQVNLEALTGTTLTQVAPLADQTRLSPPSPASLDAWTSKASSHNLQVLIGELQKQITEREVTKAQSGHLPTLDLTAQKLDARQQVFDTATGRPFPVQLESTTVGVVLNVPIFAGGLTQSQVRQQAALLDKSRADAEGAKLQATRAIKSAFLSVQSGLAQVNALNAAVKSSELALASNQLGYEVGVRINIDVLNAQQQLANAKQNLFKAQYDTLVNMLRLQAAVGQLDEDSLKQVDLLFAQNP